MSINVQNLCGVVGNFKPLNIYLLTNKKLKLNNKTLNPYNNIFRFFLVSLVKLLNIKIFKKKY